MYHFNWDKAIYGVNLNSLGYYKFIKRYLRETHFSIRIKFKNILGSNRQNKNIIRISTIFKGDKRVRLGG